jgi:hypothetical protein
MGRNFVRALPSPATPTDLPHGLQRGGVFDAGYVPPTYIDATRRTIPTDSPATHPVSEDIYGNPIGFADPTKVRAITGFGGFGMEKADAEERPSPIEMRVGIRALPVSRYRSVATPRGNVEGGIFGHQGLVNAPPAQNVPQMLPPAYIERQVNAVTGFGVGPDGIGRFGRFGGLG